MPALFVFLLKVNIALIVFCLGYYFVLRQLTFYTLNRVYLSIAIIFSTLYPLINLDNFVQQHQQLAIPAQSVIINWKTPAEHFIQQPGYWFWATIVFWIGAALFAGKLLIQLVSLFKLYKNSKPGKIQEHDVRIVKANISPFSFWQSIYINPDNLNPGDLNGILQHEQIHVTEWHTMDILLAEISVIFYWFNPGVWLIKKAVRENIEFITDRKILQKGMDSKAYQYSLLNVSFAATTSAGITNHFNFSTLKKRITMMNAKKSSAINLTRYAFLVPVVLICLFAFSLSKAELVKGGKVAYKTISASVNNFKVTLTNNITISGKKVTHKVIVSDTNKKAQRITIIETSEGKVDTAKKLTFKIVKTNDSVIWYVNGKKSSKEEFAKIKPNDIESFSVLKDHTPDGIISVRTRAENNISAVVINAKTNANNNSTTKKEYTLTYKTSDGNVAKDVFVGGNIDEGESKSHDAKIDNFSDKLFIIDGKEASEKDMRKLPASEIWSIDVNTKKEMVEKYGDKAKNGVLFITTKKAKQ
ncbi:M56 family metallopeptidase [Mucilaginibacter sp.]|uniref:M56 family metallopeptidase n=1 Tax=Mucilaginibacter sp. TaxID=1882438 RepID=UPI00261FDD8E|nr:M56 family metallopeptidase [Mucilaginibacter sp.]MDB4927092.1 hypothetical protein [Mucilaginibacter sp.]